MHFLITAGGTREYIDPVRFISNASSGRMGYALAGAAVKAGHKVTLITAPANLKPPKNAKLVRVETAGEMLDAVKRFFDKCDCLIMAAAVADYTPVKRAKTKIKKNTRLLTLRLKPTADILKWAGNHKRKGQILVGFALEDKKLRQCAEKKLKAKNLDVIIANTPAAIGADSSSVQIKTPAAAWMKLGKVSKTAAAKKIVRLIQSAAAS
ncbi:MAG: phosphopantothenoylcysteine decarboxylase domain-containing protein [Planctomycetota bacterium]|jgi:phosphopantothenoylcysteine decarboxylase/phosphopantothenate--cysteine ligase